MKTDIQELIEAADRLCASLEKSIQNEKQFSTNVLIELDKIALNTSNIADDLREINHYLVG